MTAALNDTSPAPAPTGPVLDGRRDSGAERVPADTSLDSATLLRGGRAVTIRHNGEFYRLQATRQGKLILTK